MVIVLELHLYIKLIQFLFYAKPKSASLETLEFLNKKILSSFISLCAMLFPCIYSIPKII